MVSVYIRDELNFLLSFFVLNMDNTSYNLTYALRARKGMRITMEENRVFEILNYMPDNLKPTLQRMLELSAGNLEEVRLRIGRPLIVGTSGGNYAVGADGSLSENIAGAYEVTEADVRRIFQAVCENSVYAYIDEIRQGFVTIRGGHRVGFAGRAVANGGKVENFREISSLNIRVAREVLGAADSIMKDIYAERGVVNTLLVAPPLVGKTTMLRDIARQISDSGIKVGIADDRGEIAAMYHGVPQNNVGLQTDVLDGAPKAEAVVMLLRSMAPQVIISDEISTARDAEALSQAFGTGVGVIASAHGGSFEEVISRELLRPLFGNGGFRQVIVLSRGRNGLRDEIKTARFAVDPRQAVRR